MTVDNVYRWFLENGVLLNPAKMDTVVFETQAQQLKLGMVTGMKVAGAMAQFNQSVKLL